MSTQASRAAGRARRSTTVAAALLGSALSVATLALPASAQKYAYGQGQNHVLRGVVSSFSAYRLVLASGRRTTQVDLKNGTKILPTGTQLTPGMRVMVRGYRSKGVFIANRVTLR